MRSLSRSICFVLLLVARVSSLTATSTASRTSLVPEKVGLKRTTATAKAPFQRKSTLQLQAVPLEVWTSLLPTCLGFYKSGYSVSYGYGLATALTALVILQRSAGNAMMLSTWHTYALLFYGARLTAFLAIRTRLSKRMKEFNIEDRALKKGNRWTTRTPFILSCALLYYGLATPVLWTSQLTTSIPVWATKVWQVLLGVQWFGFGLAALGDFTKTYQKQTKNDEHYLVTSGLFSVVRHPNYTGEMIGWTANLGMGFLAASIVLQTKRISIAALSQLGVMTLGWTGIVMVLLRATSNLETRQEKEYGKSDPKYNDWVQSSWSGWTMPSKKHKAEHETPHALELQEDTEEDMGSGI